MKATTLQKSMEKAMRICRKEPEDEQTARKANRKKVDHFAFLSDNILSDILKRLPEPFLGYRAKYVCRRWFDLISKKILPDRASFILQKMGNWRARHVGIREEGEGLQVKVQDLDIPRKGIIRSWGNEFLLMSSEEKGNKRYLYVYNLITKKGSYLPGCNSPCGGYCGTKCGVVISFDGFNGIHKVVHLFMGPPIVYHILMLRNDFVSLKWKRIQDPYMNGLGKRLLYRLPVSVQGRYIHWYSYGDKSLVSMDMVKEEVVDISLPGQFSGYPIFEMGGSLALFAGVSKDKGDIWILKDFQGNEWEKLQSVTLENYGKARFPVCGVMSNKYIIMECYKDGGLWYYDLKNGVVKKLDIYIDGDEGCMVHSSPPSIVL